MPCYNQAQFLDETLQSILNQTMDDWECLIIDDGSTDDTAKISAQWVLKDDRFSYYYKENGGLSNARNYGLDRATGEYIQLLDSDDMITPEKFALQCLDLKDADISVSDYLSFNHETGAIHADRYLSPFLSESKTKEEIINDWEYRKSIPCHTVLFKKNLVETHALRFNEELPNHEDWVFWVQLFYFSDKIKNRNEKLALYRIHNNSMSVDFVLMRQGFLKAAIILQSFFEENNEKRLQSLAKQKYREIKKRGITPLHVKIRKRVFDKLSRYFKNGR